MANDLQVSALSTKLGKRQYANAVEAYQDRLRESEAHAVVGILFGQFENCKGGDIFEQSLVTVLISYPRQVATKIIDPNSGIATVEHFLGIDGVKKWCDAQAETISYAADWEMRAKRQVENRGKDEVPPSQTLHLKTRAWLDRTDRAVQMMEAGAHDEAELRALTEAQEKKKAEDQKRIMDRSQQDRIAEYHAHGLEPVYADAARTIVVSLPMMLKLGARIEDVHGVPTLIRP